MAASPFTMTEKRLRKKSLTASIIRCTAALTLEYRRLPGYGEPVRVELIAYDQNYYGAKVNGRAELLVNRQQVHRLLELWK